MNNGPLFLGYGSLQDWANVTDVREPVYAVLYTESQQGQFTRIERDYVFFSQPHGNEMHYCRIPVALTEWIASECVSKNGTLSQMHGVKAWNMLREWLVESGFKVRNAIPAIPRDYIFTDGGADFLHRDPVEGYFIQEKVQP